MRDQILSEIRRLAEAANGEAPGLGTFEKATGIRSTEWRGVHWARWGDAIREAGFEPNAKQVKLSADKVFEQLALASRDFGHVPNQAERRMYARRHPEFPSHSTFDNHFRGKANMLGQFRAWLAENPDYSDILEMVDVPAETEAVVSESKRPEGWVYLIHWGSHYKIGRGDQLERRVKQVQTGLPEKGTLAHAIRTDDPVGIELYWHRRFADRQAANGEWFKLTNADVLAFKRRKFQ